MLKRLTNTWLVVRREYVERIRSKTFLIFTVVTPLFMAGSILIPAKLSEMRSAEVRRVVIVASDAAVAEAVKQQLLTPPPVDNPIAGGKRAQPSYSIDISQNTTDGEKNSLRKQVSDGQLDGFLWLTDDALAHHKVTYSSKEATDFAQNAEISNAVRTALIKKQLAQKGMSGSEVDALLTPVELDAVHITKGKEGASGISVFLTSFIMVMLLYVNVLIYGVSVMRSVVEEKSSRIMEVLLSSVTAKELLAGKILGVGAVGLTQILVWILAAVFFSMPGALASKSTFSQIQLPVSTVIWFGVFFLFGYLLYSTMYAAIGAMVNSDQEAQQMQWPAMLPIIFSIFMASPVLQHPNSQLSLWFSLIPFFAPILMFIRVAVEQPPAWQMAVCLGLLAVTIYGLLALSSRIYRVGILMYGKRPTLPELRRWLRYAG